MEFDIIHVEDDEGERRLVGNEAKKQGLTYIGLSCLQALECALPDFSARIFVVDGKFPVVDGGAIERNASCAVAVIRSHYSQARVVLYSSEMYLAALAKELDVEHRSKSQFTARGLVTELSALLISIIKV